MNAPLETDSSIAHFKGSQNSYFTDIEIRGEGVLGSYSVEHKAAIQNKVLERFEHLIDLPVSVFKV